MSDVRDLSTPCAVLDLDVMQANIDRVADHATRLDVHLRPHLKTPKSLPVAERLLARQARGATVSTLLEAEYFADGGVRDLLYANPLVPAKVERFCALNDGAGEVIGITDSAAAAQALAERAASLGRVLPMLVEIDVDGYRAGVRPGSEEFEAMVGTLQASPALELRGIMSYAGVSYHTPPDDRAALAERHRKALVDCASALEARGLACPIRSFGSTPAFMRAASMKGITEVRGGIYVFQDLFQAGIEACNQSDIALTVATTVIGVQPSHNRVIVDAGGLALSKDRSTQGHPFDCRFGWVCDDTGAVLPDVWVEVVHQEMGVITHRLDAPLDFERLKIGTVLRVQPNHADMTAAAYEGYHLVRGGQVEGFWPRINGW